MENAKRDLKSDYQSGAAALRPFYRHPFFQNLDYKAVVKSRMEFPIDRTLLQRVLLAQYADVHDAEASLANIRLLDDRNTFTVTTGHQLGWMGGPMYTIYKILSTIKLAEKIKAEHPEINVVPVFWMATEDHDAEEINHFYPEAGRKVVYKGKFKGPVGRHVLESVATEAFEPSTPEILKSFYVPGRSLAQAHRLLIHHLFGKYGLVILDGDSKELKTAFLPWIERELRGQGITSSVRGTNEKLHAAGYEPVASIREINLFFMGHGGRSGFLLDSGLLNVPDAGLTMTPQDTVLLARGRPEEFSPNVLLRPLFQEVVLPNLAYVGGWAEIGYWMQLKEAFSESGVSFPLLVPRMHGSLVTKELEAEIYTLGFVLEDIKQPLTVLQDAFLARNWNSGPLEAALKTVVDSYSQVISELEKIDPTLAISMRGEQTRTAGNLENLLKKTRKALRNRNPKPYSRIAAIKGLLAPEQGMPERMLNFTAYGPDYARLIEQLHHFCDPEHPQNEWIRLS